MLDLVVHHYGQPVSVPVPENWDELSGAQLIAIAGIIYAEQDPLRRDVKLACVICQMKPKQLKRFPTGVVSEHIMPLVSWRPEACNLTRQQVPVITSGRHTFYGPQDHLRNLRFGEFDAAERMLYAWHQDTTNTGLLWQFVAILYRPAKAAYDHALNPEGDVREVYNGNLTEGYSRIMASELDLSFAYAVSLFYKGCRDYISDRFDRIFKGGDTDQSEVAGEVAYFGLMRSIAKEGIYGTFEDVAKMYLYTALTEMEAAFDESIALQQALEDAKQQH